MAEEAGGGADKEHEPTQKRLDDARRKGEIPRSADLTTAAAYSGFLGAAVAFGPASLAGLGGALTLPLGEADWMARAIFGGGDGPGARGAPLVTDLFGRIAANLAPWVALPAGLALLAVIAQQALLFTPSRLAPKLSRISPLSTAQQKFGRAGLFEFAKSAVKLVIYCAILGTFVWTRMPRILGTTRLSPGQIGAELGALVTELMWFVLGVAAAIGLVDLLFQRADHLRRNRMSRKELRDEQKEAEGDPQMKGQRRQKAVTLALNQMMAEVPKADVVVVNPQHYAVALAWARRRGTAPRCVAKGIDEVALRIREVAAAHGVPIHADPPTARALFATVEVGEEVGTDHYRAVAAAIRFADRLRKGRP